MNRHGASAPTSTSEPIRYAMPERFNPLEQAARILIRHGGDPSSGAKTGAAAERFFSEIERRYDPLLGPNGYRSLLEQAHARAVEEHTVLENWLVRPSGDSIFGNLEMGAASEGGRAREVWDGLVALIGEFLRLSSTLTRPGQVGKNQGWSGRDAIRVDGTGGPGHGDRPTRSPSTHLEDEGHHRTHEPWRLLVLEQDLATCEAIGQALDQAEDFDVVGHALTIDDVEGEVGDGHVDFVVASGHLPSDELLELCRWFRKEHSGELPHLVVTGLPDDNALILEVLESGAAAFTMGAFSVEGLRLTIRLLARGEAVFPLRLQHLMSLRLSELAELARDRGLDPETISSLTSREKDVLNLLEEDLTNRQIARRLYISEGTVKSHVHQILHKLKARDRGEAVQVARLRNATAS